MATFSFIPIYRIVLYCLLLAFFSGAGIALAGKHADHWLARIVSIQGKVEVKKHGKQIWEPVKINDVFWPGDRLRVGEKSRAAVVLSNQAVARLDQKTFVVFSGPEEKGVSLIDLIKGAAHFFSRIPRSLKITTPFVNGAVEGTEFFVKVDDEKTLFSVFRGRVVAFNEAGRIGLGNNQSAVIRSGKPPVAATTIHPRNAVKWALYYPAIQYLENTQSLSPSTWSKFAKKAVARYRERDPAGACAALERAPKNIRDSDFFNFRAGLLLSVGRVDEARADIEKALHIAPMNSRALALKSIIALTQNRKAEALALAEKAAGLDDRSPASAIALSYAQQAYFMVHRALETLQDAVRGAPEDALVWSRLSELYLATGALDQALKAAQKSKSFTPDLERTQTVLGFAYLARIKIQEAKAAFEKAVLLDQAAPLPRLGLGLAKIREGNLDAGRAELEIAASLSPNDALVRSYLGKAFFDEKRDKQSNTQLSIAKELDPQDPTPWFYDAIRKQTLNRPVEALRDLQTSIALNDNRAVYRSRLLLDQDLAARSAGLARIYSDLGFAQLALVEGWKSINIDPSSYAAHRLLADSYAALPRHEIARVSELLQSQLLQPININPLQPHLAESKPHIYESTGPADVSFNEFNPLFLRNRLALQTSGVYGDNDTCGEEVVFSGIKDRISYSIGQFYYQSDGFRTNNDLEKDLYNIFLQTSLSHKTSLQAEYRYREIENGDLTVMFDSGIFPPVDTWREKEERYSFRFGMRHAVDAHSGLITSFIYQNWKDGLKIPPFVIMNEENDGYMGEIRHLYSSERITLNTGGGYIKIKQDGAAEEYDVDHANIYAYMTMNFPKNYTWTIGASENFYENSLLDQDTAHFSPKFGFIWQPHPTTTLRGALFKTILRELPSGQTIEPTQVAGFNQLFDDSEGTESWIYGVGIDQVFLKALYGGLEFSKRDLEFLYVNEAPGPEQIKHADWNDKLARIYLYWAPHNRLSFSAEYQFEDLERQKNHPGLGLETEIETHRVPLGIHFFHPLGFTVRFKGVYLNQKGKFRLDTAPGSYDIVPGKNQFWVFNASFGYRLPKTYGIVSIDAKNIFDKGFKYLDTDPSNPRFVPERIILAKFTLSF